MPSFCFIVTEECNWKCDYCDFPKIKDPKSTTLSILETHLPYIVEIINQIDQFVYHIDIAGGEVGLLNSEILRYFFKILNRKIVVSTNGVFMDKGYHHDPEIRPFIKEIQWHVHPKPHKVKVKDYIDSEIFINKGIVHDNVQEMIDFINENKHIEFNYVEFEFPMEGKRIKDDSMYRDLLENINLDNVTEGARDIIRGRLNERENLRSLCKKFNQTAVIDMVNENIMFCHRSQGVTIPLNRNNLLERIRKFPNRTFSFQTKCDSCTRLYAGKMSGNEIETFFKVRNMI
jgi:organic radical activating enzyme